MSEYWVQKWGDHGWAFHDPNGQEATLGVYQRKGEWRSVVQARAGLDTEDIEARVIAKLANRMAELEAAFATEYKIASDQSRDRMLKRHPIIRSVVERKEE